MHSDDGADDSLDLDRALRLDELAEEYRRALEAGPPISPDEFAGRHPEVRDELLAVLKGITLLAGRRGVTGPFRAGQRIGPYAIRGELGRGGMGVVYEAVEEELGRVVALKALDAAQTDAKFRSRFQREARAAARLDHPGIVPVFGSGEDAGTLWYAMRRVEGVALDAVLDALTSSPDSEPRVQAESALADIDFSRTTGALPAGSPAQRAAASIAMRIAEALAYAHAEGVLHRDVKPGNVMLDRDGTPLLTDFGLCKIEGDASLTADTDIVGTLRYLPPEALNGRADARGDVYGTGLVLYELLARRPAFAASDRASMLQRILHEDPEPLGKIDADVPGDLARIVAKATAKLPEERYATADDLAEDLGAFLAGQPVQARAPSALYLARLFVRRNRALVGSIVGLILALVVGIVGTSIGIVRANDARATAEANETRANAELEKARQVTAFLRSLLAGSSPWIAAGRDTALLRSILDDAAAGIEGTLAGQPEAEVLIRTTIGDAYRQIGDTDLAGLHLERAMELARAHLDPDDPPCFEVRRSMGWLELDRGDADAAEILFGENLERRPPRLDALDVEAVRDLEGRLGVLEYRFALGEILRETERVLATAVEALGRDEVEVQRLQAMRASALASAEYLDEAIELYSRLVDQQRGQYGRTHPLTMASLVGLAGVRRRMGDLDGAASLLEEHLASCRANFGDEHRSTIIAMNSYALLLRDRGDLDAAEEHLVEVADSARRELGEGHKLTLTAMFNLAGVLTMRRRFDDAEAVLRERLDLHVEHYGAAHEQTLLAQVNVAVQCMNAGEVDEAFAEYESAIESARGAQDFDQGFLGFFLLRYGQGLSVTGEHEGAENVVLEAWDLLTEAYTTDSGSCRDAALTMVLIYERWGREDDAATWRVTATEIGADLASLDRWR